ncbi:MAG: hypothetical protein SGJ00_03080, partial [bacterium]|nr:hypothetical protein [bacterium]
IKLILVIFLLISVIEKSMAQDAMILRFKTDTLFVKVLEIGTDEIKYKLWPVDESMPNMAIEKSKVKKLILQNGTILKFAESDFTDPSNYVNQRKIAIKADMFSILMGTISFGFEKSISPGNSWEAGLGIIGVTDATSNKGFFLRGGYKFINTPDYMLKGMRYTHILKGAYIKPELALSVYDWAQTGFIYSYTTNTFDINESKYRNTAFALILNFGKQWVFADRFLVDAYVGGGLGVLNENLLSKITYPNQNGTNYYGYYNINESSLNRGTGFLIGNNTGGLGFAFQAGLKLGFLIGPGANNKDN